MVQYMDADDMSRVQSTRNITGTEASTTGSIHIKSSCNHDRSFCGICM